jgi:hypothetical protein
MNGKALHRKAFCGFAGLGRMRRIAGRPHTRAAPRSSVFAHPPLPV